MSKKGLRLILGILFLGLLAWHFLIKDYNYRVSFTTKDSPGLVYRNLVGWEFLKDLENESIVELLNKQPYQVVSQSVRVNDSLFNYKWKISKTKDSLTKVVVYITDTEHQFKQNLLSPFSANNFVKRSIKTVQDLGQEWVNYRENYQIGPVSKNRVREQFCAYISLETKVANKAGSMVRNIADVMDYINANNLELKGDPFLQVTQWDQIQGTIQYDFCFPISPEDTLVNNTKVKFKTVAAFDGIKTSFNGNYSISDISWYTLLDYAKENNIPVHNLPFEIYKDDPHSGGNPIQWEAEVYLPIAQ